MIYINPFILRKCSKFLGEAFVQIINADVRNEEEIAAKLQTENKLKEEQKRISIYQEEFKMKNNSHRDTWLFNHFDAGNEFVYYKTLY